ncbi:MAG: PIN domain-containing protein [Gemmatimonadota bacterium]
MSIVYVDTSVALAHLLSEDRRPPDDLWYSELISSRLLEYEVWNRLHALDLAGSHADVARLTLARLAFVELSPDALERARHPFPAPVRTLDALHLSCASFLRERGVDIAVATYDRRQARAARAMGFDLVPLSN